MTQATVRIPTLSAQQHEAFARDGFIIVRQLLSRQIIDELAPGYDQAVRGEITDPAWTQRWKPNAILQLPNPYRTIPSWRGHRYMQIIVGVARQLLGDDIDYAYDQLIYKPAHNNVEVLWHQDAGYGWRGVANHRSLSCWLALAPVTRDMGAMQFIPASHTQGIFTHHSAAHHNPINGALEVTQFDRDAAVVVEYQPGDVTFHHGRTLHYTGPNTSDSPRRSITTHMWPADPAPAADNA